MVFLCWNCRFILQIIFVEKWNNFWKKIINSILRQVITWPAKCAYFYSTVTFSDYFNDLNNQGNHFTKIKIYILSRICNIHIFMLVSFFRFDSMLADYVSFRQKFRVWSIQQISKLLYNIHPHYNPLPSLWLQPIQIYHHPSGQPMVHRCLLGKNLYSHDPGRRQNNFWLDEWPLTEKRIRRILTVVDKILCM